MKQVIMMTSLKGGVGKTTLSAALSRALAARDRSVVAVDMDFGVRGLDLALGTESYAAPTILEWCEGKCSMEDALVPTDRENLSFIAAPINDDGTSLVPKALDACLAALSERFDTVLLDMPAGAGPVFEAVAACKEVTEAIIVATHNENSLRAARKLAGDLQVRGIEKMRLILNAFSSYNVREGEVRPLLETLFQVSVPLVGVVPYESSTDYLLNNRLLSETAKKRVCDGKKACDNIAARLCGENVSLLQGIMKTKFRASLY